MNLVDENNIDTFKNYAENKIFNEIKNTLNMLNIKFDNYFNEDDLYNNKDIKKIRSIIRDVVANILRDIWIKRTSWK